MFQPKIYHFLAENNLMQDAKRAFPFFCSGYRIAIGVAMSVFLAGSVCPQDLHGLKECESLLNAAARAEEVKDTIDAEFRYEECRELAQKYRLPKMEASALHRLAVIRAKNKKFSESAHMFRRSLELDPKNALVLCDFAQLHADRKDYDEAEKLLKKALDADPSNPKTLFNLGIIIASQRSERQTEGLRYLKLAVGEAEAYRELARIYQAKGDISRAELADQKAKLAESQVPSDVTASSSESAPLRLPKRAPHQAQTPPEIVDRVRQEIIDAETREIISTQQRHVVTSPVAQMPFIPATVNPTPDKMASSSSSSETAAMPPQRSSVPPVDPFASVIQQQEPVSHFVRRLAAPATTAFAPTAIRTTISSPTDASAAPLTNNSVLDPFAPVQITKSDSASDTSSRSHLVRISTPAKTEEKPPQPLHAVFSETPKKDAPSIRVLPTIPGGTSGVEPIERMEASNKEEGSNDVGNPLRSTLLGNSGILDSASDVSAVASLPSYSAVGTKKIPRYDHDIVQGRSETTPPKSESSLLAQPKGMRTLETDREIKRTESARTQRLLPLRDAVGDVNGQQSPSVAVVRRALPTIQSSDLESGLGQRTMDFSQSNPSVPTTAGSERAKIIPNDRRFASANAPEVVKFGSFSNNQSLAEKPNIVVAKSPIHNDSQHEVRPIVRLPQIVTSDSESPITASIDTAPTSQEMILVHPTPVVEDQPSINKILALAAAPADPFPMMTEQPKPVETQNSTEIVLVPSTPLPVANDSHQFPEMVNVEQRAPVLPVPVPPVGAALPDGQVGVTANDQPKITEVRRIEPQIIAIYPPVPAADKPTDAPLKTLPLLEYSPVLAETKKPAVLPKVTSLPIETEKMAVVKTLPDFSTPPHEMPKPLPGTETPSGFASTRKTESKVAASDDQSTGFARSRK